MEYTLCNIGVHLVNKSSLVNGTKCCKACFNERQKEYDKKRREKRNKNRKTKIYKTRVCTDCKKRKKITEFYIQKPPRIPKLKPYVELRRWDCKECHHKKVRNAYLKRTTKEQRRKYMTDYMRDYHRNKNNTLPSSYRVAA